LATGSREQAKEERVENRGGKETIPLIRGAGFDEIAAGIILKQTNIHAAVMP